MRASVILLHKKGDEKDPENYRPISLLNTDYKITTAVIASYLKEYLPDWAIPNEQLSRENVWGTIHGLMLDKSITQIARLNRAESFSSWFDFKKAYDSTHHRCIKRLVDSLPLHKNIKHTLKSAMKLWSLRIQLGKNKQTTPIAVRRGILQGDSISPLLFKLLTAGITEHLKEDTKILRATRGSIKF